MKRLFLKSTVLLCFVLLGACKDNSSKTQETPEIHQHTETIVEDTGFSVSIGSNDQMQFDKNELKVPAGEPVSLTLKHTGKMAKNVMGHNLVILKQGVDFKDFAEKAALAADSEYIPSSEKMNIIAHTKVIGGGESDTIEFTIDEPGTYEYLCTFPGHYAIMRGVIIAE